jgi:hypothetical protein
VKLWWPNGYGNHPLYNFTLIYESAKYGEEKSVRVLRGSFRTIDLIQDPIDPRQRDKGSFLLLSP